MSHALSSRSLDTRLLALCLGLFSLAASAADAPARTDPKGFRDLFASSRDTKHGVMLYVQGQSIGGQVIAFDDQIVELRSQSYSRIVVRIDRIDAVAAP